jgi:pyridoxal 5'-phosphate synthase pdxS subunit
VEEVARTGRLPVVNFAAGGVATPADAALMMQLGILSNRVACPPVGMIFLGPEFIALTFAKLGMDGVFVGSGIFKSSDPEKRAVCQRRDDI